MWLTPHMAALLVYTAVVTAGSMPAFAAGVQSSSRTTVTSIREITRDPEGFAGQKVTVVGQFRGRNLFSDLPEIPSAADDAFVLRSAEAAIWVTGVRPRGPNFELDALRRADTGRWVRVTGTVRRDRALAWIEGSSIELAPAPNETAVAVAVPAPPPSPLEILFSAPSQGEADVSLKARIRLQFSQDVDPASLKDRIRVFYSKSDSVERGEAQPPAVPFAFTYSPGNRALEIQPSSGLERFRDVIVELLDGITSTRGGPLKPSTLRFSTGGS